MARAASKAAADDLLAGERAILTGSLQAGEGGVEVRGAVLCELLTGARAWPGRPNSDVVLTGLTILGGLEIEGLAVAGLRFVGCRFEGALTLTDGRVDRLDLEDCSASTVSLEAGRIGRLRIDRLTTRGHLRLDGLVAGMVDLRGSRIGGMLSFSDAEIAGDLALRASVVGTGKVAVVGDHARIARRLLLDRDVRAEGSVTLTAAKIDSLRIRAGARIAGSLALGRAGLGEIRIEAGARLGAVVGGNLKVAGDVVIESEHGDTASGIDLSLLEVAGDLVLGEGFASAAPVRLTGCAVGGNLLLRGSLRVGAGAALDVSRLKCGRLELDFALLEGGVSLRHVDCAGMVLAGTYRCPADLPLHLGVHCAGRASLGSGERPTRIDGALSLIGHRCGELVLRGLTIAAATEGRWAGVAIAARHLEVDTYLRFGQPEGEEAVSIAGVVALDHARLGDDIRFANATITGPVFNALGPASEALSLRRAALKGDLDFAGLAATGSVDLSGIEVAGDVRLGRLSLTAEGDEERRLDLQSASVGGALRACGLALKGRWKLDLGDTSVSRLDDAHGQAWAASADTPPRMEIASLRYSDIEGLTEGRRRRTEDAVSARLAWIETHGREAHGRGAGFSPQPYRTLVAVLAEAGHDNGVKRTELAARRQQRRLAGAPLVIRLGGALLELVSGYGYAPIRAAVALLAYFLLGWAGVALADHMHAFEASPFIDGSILAVAAKEAPNGCPWLIPPLYTLDLMVPLTTLGNENFCSIRTEATVWHWLAVAYRLFGWVLLSIALLTFAGVMKREV
jgi:hypothetical protein